MKRTFICLFALALFCGLAAAQGGWVYLGKAHVDGQHDHDDIKVGPLGRTLSFSATARGQRAH